MSHVIAFPVAATNAQGEPVADVPLGRLVSLPPHCVCPWSEDFSDYDKRHMSLYALLLDGVNEGASEEELAFFVFDLDPNKNPAWVQRVVRSHVRRAHWVVENVSPLIGW